MFKFATAIAVAIGLMTAGQITNRAEAAPLGDPSGVRDALADINVIDNVQYVWGGRNYCWYANAWSGPGWYWCGYAWRRGFGWGGPVGWRGWHHRPVVVGRRGGRYGGRVGRTGGRVGHTGNARTTPSHIHFQVNRCGELSSSEPCTVDPFGLISRWSPGGFPVALVTANVASVTRPRYSAISSAACLTTGPSPAP